MKTKFIYIPASFWSNWTEPMITYYGSSNHYIVHENVIYFISDGMHVATKTGSSVKYNPVAKLSEKIKRLMRVTNI